jgi:hypothetical protein
MSYSPSHLDVNSSTVMFFVSSKHEQNLEFVLDHASDRTGVNYYDALMEMLDEAVAPFGSCREVDCYGHVNATIGVSDYRDISRVIEVCDKTVSQWIARYNINRMKTEL